MILLHRIRSISKNDIIRKAIEILKRDGLIVFFKKSINYLLKEKGLILPYALFKIKFLKLDFKLDELVNFAFDDLAGSIRPFQIRSEILELLKILQGIKPKAILEIGTARGGTLFLFSRVASEDAIIISIDLPGGEFGGGYPRWKEILYKSFALQKQKIYLLRMDSHKEETLKKVIEILNGKSLDFLFLDGDHTYEGVKKDFEMYSKLLQIGNNNNSKQYCSSPSINSFGNKPKEKGNKIDQSTKQPDKEKGYSSENGIIAFHDIVPGTGVGGVPIFWKEIKNIYKNKEIVEDWNQGGFGIGVLFIDH